MGGMRTDTAPEQIKTRLKIAEWELSKAKLCDQQVVNKENQLHLAIKEVRVIINN